MTDLAVFAWGLGVMPLAAILLHALRRTVMGHREAAWGLLAGVVAFLGLSHAMASVLVNHSLFGDEAAATLLSLAGLLVGAGLAWAFLETSLIRTEPVRILGAAALFLALHSLGDGLVLGADFVGGFSPTVRVDAVTVGATAVHRFAEGALLVVPAIVAMWKPRATFVLLFVSMVLVPAAYAPSWIFAAFADPASRGVTVLSISTFVAAAEAGFALLFLVRALLPIASADRGTRWLIWTAIGFVGISLVHFLVE